MDGKEDEQNQDTKPNTTKQEIHQLQHADNIVNQASQDFDKENEKTSSLTDSDVKNTHFMRKRDNSPRIFIDEGGKNATKANEEEAFQQRNRKETRSLTDSDIKNTYFRRKRRKSSAIFIDEGGESAKKAKAEAEFLHYTNTQLQELQGMSVMEDVNTIIQEIQGHILARMGKYSKNDGKESKQSFLNWLKECEKCDDDDKKALIALRNQAVDWGIKISGALLDLKFFLSFEKFYEFVDRLKTVEIWYKSVAEVEHLVVIQKINEVLEMADDTLNNMKQSDVIRNPLTDGAPFFDGIISRLIEEMFTLELLWTDKSMPDSKNSLKDALPSMQQGIENCGKEVTHIQAMIDDWLTISAFGADIGEMKNGAEYRAMKEKIKQLWDQEMKPAAAVG